MDMMHSNSIFHHREIIIEMQIIAALILLFTNDVTQRIALLSFKENQSGADDFEVTDKKNQAFVIILLSLHVFSYVMNALK